MESYYVNIFILWPILLIPAPPSLKPTIVPTVHPTGIYLPFLYVGVIVCNTLDHDSYCSYLSQPLQLRNHLFPHPLPQQVSEIYTPLCMICVVKEITFVL